MKLYHGTDYTNIDSITETGLIPTDGGTKAVDPERETIQGKGVSGVYGFVSIEDAKLFCFDNAYNAIFEFDANEANTINDPEFDGVAKFVITNNPIVANLVWEQ